jgi:phosphopantothenoylcysteine decarboxylase
MARIILGVTGSVAAIKIPELTKQLIDRGHELRLVATEPSLHFFDPGEVERLSSREGVESGLSLSSSNPHHPKLVFRDEDEWPPERYQRGNDVLHIAFRNWADLLIVAPLDANTLAKFAIGLCDNFLSCLFRAWDFEKPVVLAPAMNTLMWQSPVTRRQLAQLLADRATAEPPQGWSLEEASAVFARFAPRLILVPPQSKRLACGDIGVGAMADVSSIVDCVRDWSLWALPA